MAYYPIVKQNEPSTITTDNRTLPEFYMEDFSILGFRVSNCDDAMRILYRHDFMVKQTDGYTRVKIEMASQVSAVVQLLMDNDLECDVADVADGIYQG